MLPFCSFIAKGQLTWQKQICPLSSNLISVSFANTLNGWVISETGEVLNTSNGGKDWELQNELSDLHATKIFFLTQNKGWITGYSFDKNRGRLLYTDDSGENWHYRCDSLKILFNDVFFINENRGWVAGFDKSGDTVNYIMFSDDGGESWKRQMDNHFLNGAMLNISFRDSVNGNICGSGGFFVLTSDKGDHWWLSIYNWQIDLTDIANVGEKYGCMVGSGGKAYITKDSWTNTTAYDLPVDDTLRAITGLNNLKFWAVGDNGAIVSMVYSPILFLLVTNNQSIENTGRLNDVTAVDDKNVWAVGESGTILHFGIENREEPIGLSEKQMHEFTIYPNPAGNWLEISGSPAEQCEVNIYKPDGTIMITKTISVPGSIEIECLDDGTYILELRINQVLYHKLMMKQ